MKFNLQAIRKKNPKRALYLKKKLRIRKKITGSNVRPRLCIFKSIKAIHVQAINDKRGITLASASSLSHKNKKNLNKLNNIEIARYIGKDIGKTLKNKKIKTIILDRNGFRYNGRIAALANGARESGLIF